MDGEMLSPKILNTHWHLTLRQAPAQKYPAF